MGGAERKLRVCYFGTFSPQDARHRINVAGLRAAGAQVFVCNRPLWRDTQDRVGAASGGWARPAFWGRALWRYAGLVFAFVRLPTPDVIVVGYPGPVDVLVARLLARRGTPIVWDVLMSLQLIAAERGLDRSAPWTYRALRAVERFAAAHCNRLLCDTPEYARWLQESLPVPAERCRLLPLGSDWTELYAPLPTTRFTVLYHGSFIPNHGVEFILEAAAALRDEPDIEFVLVGRGPQRADLERTARGAGNVTFLAWQHGDALRRRVAGADVCLGAFGVTKQSLITIHNKILEALALGRAVITGDSPPVRRQFTHGEHLYICARADGAAIATAVRTLHGDAAFRQRLQENGRRLVAEKYSAAQIGRTLYGHLRELSP